MVIVPVPVPVEDDQLILLDLDHVRLLVIALEEATLPDPSDLVVADPLENVVSTARWQFALVNVELITLH